MGQLWIVAVLVLVATAYTIWYVLPAPMRPRLGRVHRWFVRSNTCSACQDCRGCAAGSKLGSDPANAAEQVIRLYLRGE